jgi:hypothetical protein
MFHSMQLVCVRMIQWWIRLERKRDAGILIHFAVVKMFTDFVAHNPAKPGVLAAHTLFAWLENPSIFSILVFEDDLGRTNREGGGVAGC